VPTLIGRGLTSEFARTTHGTAKLCECEWRTSDPERVARLCWPMVNFSATPAIEASTTLSEMDDRSAESPISVFDPMLPFSFEGSCQSTFRLSRGLPWSAAEG